jgi:hypothetical protein
MAAASFSAPAMRAGVFGLQRVGAQRLGFIELLADFGDARPAPWSARRAP